MYDHKSKMLQLLKYYHGKIKKISIMRWINLSSHKYKYIKLSILVVHLIFPIFCVIEMPQQDVFEGWLGFGDQVE